jgi:hypothetical protein
MIPTDWSIGPVVDDIGFYFSDNHHYNRVGMLKFADATITEFLKVNSIPTYCTPQNSACAPAPLSSVSQYSAYQAPSSSSSQPFTITEPTSGSVLYIGNILNLQWITHGNIRDAYPEVSLDSGRTWLSMGLLTSIVPTDPIWQNFSWKIPATMMDQYSNTKSLDGVRIRVD